MSTIKRCRIGIWDSTIPGISFDENDVSNFAKIQYRLMENYPRGEKGYADWLKILQRVKADGKKRNYDCVVGVSGGVDSSYLLYLLKHKFRLRPLAVTLDNGWNSKIAVRNIKLITDALRIDLETYVLEYEEIKDLIRSYMYAGLPWIDTPTDTAIKALMYRAANQEGIKYIFRGNDFRTEGKQPREWTYSDDRQMKNVHKRFGRLKKLKSFLFLPFRKIVYYSFIRGIKEYRPYYYLDYSKRDAIKFLENEFGWKYYGGHHHENVFTKFVISYWLKEKFKIDKRLITLSAQVVSGLMTRDAALSEISDSMLTEEQKNETKKYIAKKLDFSIEELDAIFLSENHSYKDYPNNESLLYFVIKYLNPLIRLIYPQKPMTIIEMEMNNPKKVDK